MNIPMKPLCLAALLIALAPSAFGADPFPGLKAILSQEEWQRARLDRLSPDELGVIDAALIRYHSGRETAHRAEVGALRQEVQQVSEERKRGILERFGMPVFGENDWRDMPPLQAKVVAWAGGNKFRLDNGQVWEGVDPIPYELVNKNVEIQARPLGRYALVVEGANTTIRVIRLR